MNIKQFIQSFDAGDVMIVSMILAACVPWFVWIFLASLLYMIGNFAYCRWKVSKDQNQPESIKNN